MQAVTWHPALGAAAAVGVSPCSPGNRGPESPADTKYTLRLYQDTAVLSLTPRPLLLEIGRAMTPCYAAGMSLECHAAANAAALH